MSSTKTTSRLIVYRNGPAQNRYLTSPFITKLEARLRFAEVPYRNVFGSKKQAPRGKFPYLGFEDQEELISDTTLIFRQLVESGELPDANAGLAPAEKAQDLAIRALLEEKLYFYIVRERWMDNFYAMRPNALAGMPYLVQVIIGNIAYRTVKNALHLQGTGRFTPEEARFFKQECWENLSAILAEARIKSQAGSASNEPFWVLGGRESTEADSVVYGFIVGSLVCEAGPESREMIRGLPVLMDYVKRIHDRYFGDYEGWEA